LIKNRWDGKIFYYYPAKQKFISQSHIITKKLNFMPKLKTRKAASKRYKITGNDNFLRRHAFKGHLLMKKSNRQKRKLSQVVCVSARDSNAIKLMLPY
jgi:large subunit ribosomal protein L35